MYWTICNVDLIPMSSKGNLECRGWHQDFEWNDNQERNGEVEVWCSNSSASTYHVQNQFHNLQNWSIDLGIIVDPMAIARILKDIKLHYHVVTMKEKKTREVKTYIVELRGKHCY